MKKLLVLLLVVVMCLPLVACVSADEITALNERIEALEEQLKNDNAENKGKEIIGEWKGVNVNWTLDIREDGTAISTTSSETTYTGAWKYDSELGCYLVDIVDGILRTAKIDTEENGARYIKISGEKFYHVDDLDKVETEN